MNEATSSHPSFQGYDGTPSQPTNQQNTSSTSEPLLTPMKVRGKRRSKAAAGAATPAKKRKTDGADLQRVEQAVSEAAGLSMAEHQAALSRGRLGTLRSAHKRNGSRLLEMLPFEILERIFMYADSIHFPRASPLLGRALSQPIVLKQFTMRRFALTWDCYHGRIQLPDKAEGHRELKESEDGKIQGKLEIVSAEQQENFVTNQIEPQDAIANNVFDIQAEVISQKWFKLDIFIGALELWHRNRNMTHFYTCWYSRKRSIFLPDPDIYERNGPDVGYLSECICPKPLSVSTCVSNIWRLFSGYVQRGCAQNWFEDISDTVGINFHKHGSKQDLPGYHGSTESGYGQTEYSKEEKEKAAADSYVMLTLLRFPAKYRKFLWYPSFRCIDGFNHCVVPEHILKEPWSRQDISISEYARRESYMADPDVKMRGRPPPVPLPAPSSVPLSCQDDVDRMKLMFMLTMPDFETLEDEEREASTWEPQMQLFSKYLGRFAFSPTSILKAEMGKSPLMPPEAIVCLLSCLQLELWPMGIPDSIDEIFQSAAKKLRTAMKRLWKKERRVTVIAEDAMRMFDAVSMAMAMAISSDLNLNSWFFLGLQHEE